MREYVIRRLLAAAVVVALVSVMVFIMMHLFPGDALLVKLGETGRHLIRTIRGVGYALG